MSITMIQFFAAVLSLTVIGGLFGFILSVAQKKLHVEKDPRVEEIFEILPGANCGACGCPGCMAYAEKIVNNNMDTNLCPVGGPETANKVADAMGKVSGNVVRKISRVHCQGGKFNARNKFKYEGPQTCAGAQLIDGGYRVCSYGCLGLGDCADICPFGAIHIDERKLPVVDLDKCTGCGKCEEVCPRNVISLVPRGKDVYVMCRNREKGPLMKQGCSAGCIGCKLCETKACKIVFQNNTDVESAIKVDNFIAEIDYSVCIDCGKCASVCPQKVIFYPEKTDSGILEKE
ncbi:MAG: RnfABCDGE type electron transport complex subunit B [Spirochaetes bacterium]|nr:RnfABCDGE type electron transport complex subunit B [Spirochaetota bacterium]